jgi:hypothetical protein
LIVFFEFVKRFVIAHIISFGVGNRNRQNLARFKLAGVGRVLIFDLDVDVPANEMQILVTN